MIHVNQQDIHWKKCSLFRSMMTLMAADFAMQMKKATLAALDRIGTKGE